MEFHIPNRCFHCLPLPFRKINFEGPRVYQFNSINGYFGCASLLFTANEKGTVVPSKTMRCVFEEISAWKLESGKLHFSKKKHVSSRFMFHSSSCMHHSKQRNIHHWIHKWRLWTWKIGREFPRWNTLAFCSGMWTYRDGGFTLGDSAWTRNWCWALLVVLLLWVDVFTITERCDQRDPKKTSNGNGEVLNHPLCQSTLCKKIPTDPWNIPQTLNYLFMVWKSFHIYILGYLGYVAGVCWNFLRYWCFQKIGGKPPKWIKMDGLFHGKNPIKMDDLGGKNPYFWFNTHISKPFCLRTLFLRSLPMKLSSKSSRQVLFGRLVVKIPSLKIPLVVRKPSPSNHPFSGANLLLVSGSRVCHFEDFCDSVFLSCLCVFLLCFHVFPI